MKKNLLFYILLLIAITSFSQTQKGNDIDGEAANDYSGSSVSISSDGGIVAIGAPNNRGRSGHVRVYQYNSSTSSWDQIGNDIDGEAPNDESGFSVSISSDGGIVAIGAFKNYGINGTGSGHVRVYQYNSSTSSWDQIGNDIDGEAANDLSGYSVSISSDGSIVAIGARLNGSSGHVRVYQYNSSTSFWDQIGNDIDGEAANDLSGSSVSISSDGGIVAIGAPNNRGRSGHVRVYQYNSSTSSWDQIGNDIDGEAPNDQSGSSVSISSDGSIVAIGAFGNNNGRGHVRIYQYNTSTSSWDQIGNDIDGEAPNDQSGSSVSISSDGSIVAIGAFVNNNGRGHVRIYQYNTSTSSWDQKGIDIDGEAAGDQSGSSVSISSDGSIVAIGARFNDGIYGSNSGHARVYDLSQVVLSLEDNSISKILNIYPNPVKEKLQLNLSKDFVFKKAVVYNYNGQKLLESTKTIINISSFKTGIYYVLIETNKGKGVKKIIKE
jgi:hypothetical protein